MTTDENKIARALRTINEYDIETLREIDKPGSQPGFIWGAAETMTIETLRRLKMIDGYSEFQVTELGHKLLKAWQTKPETMPPQTAAEFGSSVLSFHNKLTKAVDESPDISDEERKKLADSLKNIEPKIQWSALVPVDDAKPIYQRMFVAFSSVDGQPTRIALSAVDADKNLFLWVSNITSENASDVAQDVADRLTNAAGQSLDAESPGYENSMMSKLMEHHLYGVIDVPISPISSAPRLFRNGAKVIAKLTDYLKENPYSDDPETEVKRLAVAWVEALI